MSALRAADVRRVLARPSRRPAGTLSVWEVLDRLPHGFVRCPGSHTGLMECLVLGHGGRWEHDPGLAVSRLQHGDNPEARLVVDDHAFVGAACAACLIDGWVRRVHAYERGEGVPHD